MFVLVTMASITAAWYAHRLHVLKVEREKIVGEWQGLGSISPARISISDSKFDLGMPHNGIGQIDFPMDNGKGIAKGIYRIDGDVIQVAQSEPGKPRPSDFKEFDKGVSVWSAKRIAPDPPQH